MININIESDPKFKNLNHSIMSSLISYVMDSEGICEADLSFVFGNDKLLNNLKKQFFQKDHFTDVIAFRLNDYDEENVEGEVYISLPRAKANAKKFDQPYNKEIARLIIHGSLHLLGYTDSSKKDKTEMTKKEDIYLTKINWNKIYE
jgi:probable rRNA maturation factor